MRTDLHLLICNRACFFACFHGVSEEKAIYWKAAACAAPHPSRLKVQAGFACFA